MNRSNLPFVAVVAALIALAILMLPSGDSDDAGPTPVQTETSTPSNLSPTPTNAPSTPTKAAPTPTNTVARPTPRSDCATMRDTAYRAAGEREWFLDNCVTPEPVVDGRTLRLTWYGEPFRGQVVYCGSGVYGRYDPDDPTTATGVKLGYDCGTRLQLCTDAECIVVVVKDKCGGCGPAHIDVSRAAWEALDKPEYVQATVIASAPAAPVSGGNANALPLPDGTSVNRSGCASDGTCYWYNFYWAPTHEAVLQPGEGQHKVQHELCHAHQHWSINGGAPLAPSDYDLESWYGTAEGQSFTAAVAGQPWPWTHSAVNGLEDFAWTCAYWYLDPAHLLQVGGQARYDWARGNLP